MKKKILSLQSDLPNEGGLGTVVFSLQKQFEMRKKIRNQVVVIKVYDSLGLATLKNILRKKVTKKTQISTENNNFQVIFLKNSITDKIINKFIDSNWQFKKQVTQIENQVDISIFDIIHGHFYSPNGKFANALAKKYNKKSIVTFHGSDTINLCKSEQQYINSFDQVTFVSNFLYNTVRETIRLEAPYRVIYNGIDQNVFHLENTSKKRNIIAYCGRLHPIKGVKHLKTIFAQLAITIPDAQFHIYGEGIEREELEIFFQTKAIPVQFFGKISSEKLVEYLQNVKILVVPSVKEGFSCAIPEAKSCGAYVVAANVGGIPEAIGTKGSLIDRDDNFETNMIAEIERIWKEEDIDVQILSKDNIYSWKDIAKQYEEIYQEIVNDDN